MKFGFRVDAGDGIGFGHYFRSLAIGASLAELGHDVFFLISCAPAWVTSAADSSSIKSVNINSDISRGSQGAAKSPLILEKDDAIRTASVAQGLDLDLVVIDHYGIDDEWLSTFQVCEIDLLQIADSKALEGVQWVLDYGFDASKQKHCADTRARTSMMLGPTYAPLTTASMNPRTMDVIQPSKSKPLVVVALGSGMVSDILRNLANTYLEREYFFDLCIVSNDSKVNSESESGLSWVSQLYGLSDLLSVASFALTSGGVTMYEMIARGVPGVVINTAGNQKSSLSGLKAESLGDFAVIDLSEFDPNKILNHMARSIRKDSPDTRILPKSRVDLYGAKRVALALTNTFSSERLSFRHYHPGDAAVLLRWANDPEARSASLTRHEVSPEEHMNWLSKLESNGSRILVFEHWGVPCGQVRFEETARGLMMSYMLDDFFRGKGLSQAMLASALGSIEPATQVLAKVRNSNEKSRRALERQGFRVLSRSHDFLLMQLS